MEHASKITLAGKRAIVLAWRNGMSEQVSRFERTATRLRELKQRRSLSSLEKRERRALEVFIESSDLREQCKNLEALINRTEAQCRAAGIT